MKYAVCVNQCVNRNTTPNYLMNTYLGVLCYRSKTLTDGTSPILLRLTRNRKRKYVSLGLSLDPKFWDFNKNAPKMSEESGYEK